MCDERQAIALSVTIKTDRARIAARINAGIASAIPAVSEQALADCNEYCRVDQGQLKESSQTASDVKAGKLAWNTPYARRVYYTGTPSKDQNPNASLMWCETAHDAHGKEWNEIAQKQFEKGMGK